MKSALFVDFDNVYSQLRQLKPEAAERFSRHPSDWIEWLVNALPLPEPHGEGERRRLLVRRCYLNPNWYQTYRHAFLRAGFEIVDCPPVTSQGKTSTDIHMVLDVVDLLEHETRYDEFIVFSADADFTPVLRKLRRYDRRTTVLAIGFPSAAYQASADLLIDERAFIQDALGFGRGTKDSAHDANGLALDAASSNAMPTPPTGAPLAPTKRVEAAANREARATTADDLTAIANRIWLSVEESPQPVAAGLLASRLRQEFPEVLDTWNGQGSFKQFYRSLGLSRLVWASGSGGRILDAARHEIEGNAWTLEPESPWFGNEAMFAVVREVCSLTGAPMLAPAELRAVLVVLADALKEPGFELGPTARRVCERCLQSRGLRVRLRDVTFLLRGMQMNGHVFGQDNDGEATLVARLIGQILFLCQREQMVLDVQAVAHIGQWISGKAERVEPATP